MIASGFRFRHYQPPISDKQVFSMNRAALFIIVASIISSYPAHARAGVELVNDFHCTLQPNTTFQDLVVFQKAWMEGAKENGFDESYRTYILAPLYSEDTRRGRFIWRGHFKNGEQFGRMIEWFPTSVEWVGKFAQVMDCDKSSLWRMAG
jgi:hypothetical protein